MSRPDIPTDSDSVVDTDPRGLPVAMSCWVVTDGKAGMEIQCLGLAEALGLEPQVKRVSVGKPWRWLPAGLLRPPLNPRVPQRDRLPPHWPALWIAHRTPTGPLTRHPKPLRDGPVFPRPPHIQQHTPNHHQIT